MLNLLFLLLGRRSTDLLLLCLRVGRVTQGIYSSTRLPSRLERNSRRSDLRHAAYQIFSNRGTQLINGFCCLGLSLRYWTLFRGSLIVRCRDVIKLRKLAFVAIVVAIVATCRGDLLLGRPGIHRLDQLVVAVASCFLSYSRVSVLHSFVEREHGALRSEGRIDDHAYLVDFVALCIAQ